MGTDIHMFAERKIGYGEKKWASMPVPEKFTERNYRFFAALANVRNGFGFAGVTTHSPIVPITDNRGFPEDISSFGDKWSSFYNSVDCDEHEENLIEQHGFDSPGDHSAGYATLKEIKEFDRPIVKMTGQLPWEKYIEWKESGDNSPHEWCGSCSGNNVVHLSESDLDNMKSQVENLEKGKIVYVVADWDAPLLNDSFMDELIAWMQSYVSEYQGSDEDVRLIFNFDS